MNWLITLDSYLFAVFNKHWICGFLDTAMPLLTNAKLWMPFLLAGWLWLLLGCSGKKRWLAFCLLFATGVTDLVSARIIKKAVGRARPCITETDARCLIGRKTSKSFPSSHAANSMAFATTLTLLEGVRIGLPVVALALTIGYSRIYVGVHYPFDVLVGWLLGAVLAWGLVRAAAKMRRIPASEPPLAQAPPPASPAQAPPPTGLPRT